MKSKSLALLLLIVLLVLSAGWIFYAEIYDFFHPSETIKIQRSAEEAKPTGARVAQPERMPMPARHPVAPPRTAAVATEPPQAELPLPTSLNQADAYLVERLQQLIVDRKLLVLLNLNYFIPKLVLFIDHLPEKSIPRLHLPLTPPAPGFLTRGSAEKQFIAKRNAARYTPYIKLVEAVPDAPLLQLYRGLYPLFQQAYREAGDPNAHFNDRLILAIDDLLQTPEPREPLRIIHHVSQFKYADVSLEARSAGQKILLRMGVENSRRVKAKLQKIRQGLIRQDW